MFQRPFANPGAVDWTGENPGMYLKEDESGEWTCLVSFFRVLLSPHGGGHAALVMFDPTGRGAGTNACFTDNEPLARYLLREFVPSFGSFKGNPRLETVEYRQATEFRHEGDGVSLWREIVRGPGVDLTLEWRDLDPPFVCNVPVEQSATGRHDLYTVFAGARSAVARLGDEVSRGRPSPRDAYGHMMTTAFLAFSETWVKA